jgi:hypothetical protein
VTSQSPFSRDQLAFPWQDSERPIEERAESLRTEMSLEDKVATRHPSRPLTRRWVPGLARCPQPGPGTHGPAESPQLSTREIPTDGGVTASVRARNTGARAGEEIVQLRRVRCRPKKGHRG